MSAGCRCGGVGWIGVVWCQLRSGGGVEVVVS